jgi:hypothetical protein
VYCNLISADGKRILEHLNFVSPFLRIPEPSRKQILERLFNTDEFACSVCLFLCEVEDSGTVR